MTDRRHWREIKPEKSRIKVTMMLDTIDNYDKVHFAVLAIGATAKAMQTTPSDVYLRLKKFNLIKLLLFDCYDTLHAESIDGVVWNVTEALKSRES